MYNPITESIITSVPPINEVDIQELPTLLSKVYAEIFILKSNYEENECTLSKEIKDDCDKLAKIAFSLELYMLSEKFEEKITSISYVAATALKILGYVRNENNDVMSCYNIPNTLVTALLFIIGDNYADASEICDKSEWKSDNDIENILLENIKKLILGRIQHFSNYTPECNGDYEKYAIDLLWNEVNKGVLSFAQTLKTKSLYDNKHLETAIKLSVSNDYAYTGIYRLSYLLKLAFISLQKKSTIAIPAPDNVNKEFWEKWISHYNMTYPYLWSNHLKAINEGLLHVGVSAVVTYPTGAGKSTIINLKIASCHASGKDTIYIVPTHALESQVKNHMNQFFNFEKLGTSLYKKTNTQVKVMTPEKCLSLLYLQDDFLNNVGLVVFDEFHIIGEDNNTRSLRSMTVLVSLLTKLPEADYLLVSAMISNSCEVVSWINHCTKRTCLDLNYQWKPTTQLQGVILYQNDDIRKLESMVKKEHKESSLKGPSSALKRKMEVTPHCLFGLKAKWTTLRNDDYYLANIIRKKTNIDIDKEWNIVSNKNKVGLDIASVLSKSKKVLLFVDKPDTVCSLLSYANKLESFQSYDASNIIDFNFNDVFEELGGEQYSYIEKSPRILMHHGLMLPQERNFSEKLFRRNDGINVLIATTTLAQGINMPADVVIISGDWKYDPKRERKIPIEAHDILNAAGRAGRAGQHSSGVVILIPSDITTINNDYIGESWFRIHDKIFSKGDNCMEIVDPIQELLEKIANGSKIQSDDICIQRFLVQSEETDRLIKNSFFAYQYSMSQRQTELNKLMNDIKLNQQKNNAETEEWIKEIAISEGVPIHRIEELSVFFQNENVENKHLDSVDSILDIYFDCLSKNSKSDSMISSEILYTFGMNGNVILSSNDIYKFKTVIKKYINGENFYEINSFLTTSSRDKKYLNKARMFVLRRIPSISYHIGIFAKTLEHYLTNKGIEISNEVKYLATIVKEGVNSYDMLQFMQNKKYMRVRTHKEYKNRQQ